MSKTLNERFEEFNEDFLKGEKEEPREIEAFTLLQKIAPIKTGRMISASEHDEFFLSVDCRILNDVAKDEEIRRLVQLGVRYDDEYDCLCMYA